MIAVDKPLLMGTSIPNGVVAPVPDLHDVKRHVDRHELLLPGKHYTAIEQVPRGVQKYYHQRYSIFSKYDDGIRMTDNAWYGVTPEPVAM